jgi:hypothetical protein
MTKIFPSIFKLAHAERFLHLNLETIVLIQLRFDTLLNLLTVSYRLIRKLYSTPTILPPVYALLNAIHSETCPRVQ